jgi:hypothetical protein
MSDTFLVKRSEWERRTGDGGLSNEEPKCSCLRGLSLLAHGAKPEDLVLFQRPAPYFKGWGHVPTPLTLALGWRRAGRKLRRADC